MSSSDRFQARAAYDQLAAHYDDLTTDYDHELWLGRLLALVGGAGPRVLDVACGTGKSFAPLIGYGYEISACDISPSMLSIAASRLAPGMGRTFVADMRALPECGCFDLITCLDDAVNYVLTSRELLDVFTGVARLLDRHGAFVFDTNTVLTYRTAFASVQEITCGSAHFRWRGLGRADALPGSESAAVIERLDGGRVEQIATHRQRHHATCDLAGLLDAAGLVAELVVGQSTGCRLHRGADQRLHTKTVFVARRARVND
jgi:SAM-dependent methyltransferase